MKCPNCDFVQSDRKARCLKCGIIFEKYQTSAQRTRAFIADSGSTAEEGTFFQDVVFFVEPRVNPFYFGGRMIIFAVAFVWGWKFIFSSIASNDVGNSFLHRVLSSGGQTSGIFQT